MRFICIYHCPISVTKKDSIEKPTNNLNLPAAVPPDVAAVPPDVAAKKSIIPMEIFGSNVVPPKIDSFPVQLRIHSPNMKLRGIVPHITEYGKFVCKMWGIKPNKIKKN